MKYDFLIVGSGLFGATVAYELSKSNKVLVIEKRNHIGGNCYTEFSQGINVHMYGAHIFKTSSEIVWKYISQFCEFNNFVNTPIANNNGRLFNLPFNMNTFNRLWGVVTPEEAKEEIARQTKGYLGGDTLEDHALSMVGKDIYELLIKGYTEKQWGRSCSQLPASIMRRIPLRFTYDNNYYNEKYQGIPLGGYTKIFEKMLSKCDIETGVNYLEKRSYYEGIADRIIYTGPIDEYYEFSYGPLEYRSLSFEHVALNEKDHQGVAVMNFTDVTPSYTRVIEHKHFDKVDTASTIISYEYPTEWTVGAEPYYPLEDSRNRERYLKYAAMSASSNKVFFGGRLGEYRYHDMQDTIKSAFDLLNKLNCCPVYRE